MSVALNTRYTCDRCGNTRSLTFQNRQQETQIFVPRNNPNGLFVYTDIHRCLDGILGINNLHIDKNNAVRSIEILTLPSEKIFKNKIPGLPSPKVEKEEFEKIRVSGIDIQDAFRLRILNRDLGIDLIIGDVILDSETPLGSYNSSNNRIKLEYYQSQIPYDENIKSWMVELINLLEILPPTKIGLFVETLRYIYKMRRIGPAKFHVEMLETILLSHEIYFDLVDDENNFEKIMTEGKEKYGADAAKLMIKLLSYIEVNPKASLRNYTETHHEDLSHLIYIFLTLDQEKMIHIYKPSVS